MNQLFTNPYINQMNFSTNSNQENDNDLMRKTYEEQKNRKTKVLNSLLDPMKKKMEEGSKMQSLNNSHVYSNNSQISSNFNNNINPNIPNFNSGIINPQLNNNNMNNNNINLDNGFIMNNTNSVHNSNSNSNSKLVINADSINGILQNNMILNNNKNSNMNINNFNMNNNINNNIMNSKIDINNFNMNNNINNNIMDNNMNISNFNMNNNIMDNNMNISNFNMNNNIINNMDNNMNINNFNMNNKINFQSNIDISKNIQFNQNQMDNVSKKTINSNNDNNSFNQINPINQNNVNLNNNLNSINQNISNNLDVPMPLNPNNQIDLDQLKKSEIMERHSVELSSYYDYTPGETEDNLNQLLEDINYFGDITKREIQKEKSENPDKFIYIDEAIKKGENSNNNKFKNEYFVLSILAKALMSQSCLVVIEKDKPQSEEANKEINTTLQFLVNGMYNFKKYIFHFDFGEEKNEKLLKNIKEQKYFNRKLRKKLKDLFNLKESDIIMTNPRKGTYSITAIIKKANFNELTEQELFQELIKDNTFSALKKIEENILLSGCKLNPYMLDARGNNKDGGWGFNETRGGHPYYPPKGWIGYGLRVLDRFDYEDNSWLDYRGLDGEWSVAYHGIGYGLRGKDIFNNVYNISIDNLKTGIKQEFKDSNDCFNNGNKVGEGVYTTPKPEVMEDYCGIFNCNGKKYKIAFMTRVMPKKIRCPEENKDYWIINGTDNEVRPYRILIKEVQ